MRRIPILAHLPSLASKIRALRVSLAFRLALLYGLAVAAVMLVVSVMFYDGTVGVLGRGIDRQLTALSARLDSLARRQDEAALATEIERLLSDGVASDTEVFLLAHADGTKLIGNVAPWAWSAADFGHLKDQPVLRLGRPSTARILVTALPDGDVLVVGRDMPDQQEIRRLVARALLTGGAVALVMAFFAALLFHRRIEQRLAAVRLTASRIESGQWDWRIPPGDDNDEFARLDNDINGMLDRIQTLMDGVRHVSNAIAHDLRTPLGRLRAHLDDALRSGSPAQLEQAARRSIEGIDQLIILFERLLQITEAESGARRQSFTALAVAPLLHVIAELYDAVAEEKSARLTVDAPVDALLFGDRALLSTLLANLVENALKYAPAPSRVKLALIVQSDRVEIMVEDNGPGIPPAERAKVLERFYRLDRSRSLPGNGLGLALVAAVVTLHDGSLSLEDAEPGLRVRIILPRLPGSESFQTLS
jgi:signal transduction histidine kinase